MAHFVTDRLETGLTIAGNAVVDTIHHTREGIKKLAGQIMGDVLQSPLKIETIRSNTYQVLSVLSSELPEDFKIQLSWTKMTPSNMFGWICRARSTTKSMVKGDLYKNTPYIQGVAYFVALLETILIAPKSIPDNLQISRHAVIAATVGMTMFQFTVEKWDNVKAAASVSRPLATLFCIWLFRTSSAHSDLPCKIALMKICIRHATTFLPKNHEEELRLAKMAATLATQTIPKVSIYKARLISTLRGAGPVFQTATSLDEMASVLLTKIGRHSEGISPKLQTALETVIKKVIQAEERGAIGAMSGQLVTFFTAADERVQADGQLLHLLMMIYSKALQNISPEEEGALGAMLHSAPEGDFVRELVDSREFLAGVNRHHLAQGKDRKKDK